MTAPDVPAWLDCTKGALSCQHSSVDLPLAVATVVTFRREGTEGVCDRVKAGMMRVKRTPAVRRIVKYISGCKFVGYGSPAACTADGS